MKRSPAYPESACAVEFLQVDQVVSQLIPLYASRLSCGFPSPAEDNIELRINILELVTDDPSSTYFVKVLGDSMEDAHIVSGSVLAVNKAREPKNNDIVVCVINNEFTVKRLFKTDGGITLLPENKKYKPLVVTGEMQFRIFGVVVTILHNLV